MKITFDSNAWEQLFNDSVGNSTFYAEVDVIKRCMRSGKIEGFICEASFRLEAIEKRCRAAYFGLLQPSTRPIERDGLVGYSIGPDDSKHPGLPPQQIPKLIQAHEHGVRLMRGLSWLDLPCPKSEYLDKMRVDETNEQRGQREQIQIDVFYDLKSRGVGYDVIDRIRRDIDSRYGYEHPGWSALLRVSSKRELKRVAMAIAEWADSEIVAAHVANHNDVICTLDVGKTQVSTFDSKNRAWLRSAFGLRCQSLHELAAGLRGASLRG